MQADPMHPTDRLAVQSMEAIASNMPKPTPQQRILGAIAVAVEGDSAPAMACAWLTWPGVVRPSSARLRGLAAQVLLAAARATLGRLPPEHLEQISQELEPVLAQWPPRFAPQGGGTHWRPE